MAADAGGEPGGIGQIALAVDAAIFGNRHNADQGGDRSRRRAGEGRSSSIAGRQRRRKSALRARTRRGKSHRRSAGAAGHVHASRAATRIQRQSLAARHTLLAFQDFQLGAIGLVIDAEEASRLGLVAHRVFERRHDGVAFDGVDLIPDALRQRQARSL